MLRRNLTKGCVCKVFFVIKKPSPHCVTSNATSSDLPLDIRGTVHARLDPLDPLNPCGMPKDADSFDSSLAWMELSALLSDDTVYPTLNVALQLMNFFEVFTFTASNSDVNKRSSPCPITLLTFCNCALSRKEYSVVLHYSLETCMATSRLAPFPLKLL